MNLVDAHCHFDFSDFDGQREQVLSRAKNLGVSRVVIPGVRRHDWGRVAETSANFPGTFYCLGIHPWYVRDHDEVDLLSLEAALAEANSHCVGLGECGLDRLKGSLSQQVPWFEAQVGIAKRQGLPLIVHSVRTHDEVCGILKAQGFAGRVLIHGFSGSYQQACKLVDLGCYIGVGGVVTYARARKTRDAIARLPIESLVLETDAPDMPPEGVEKGRNSPEFLPVILDSLAELRAFSREALADQILRNTCRLYGWSANTVGD
ncbi:TatD family hydrolase [Marinobacter sp.]|uniref:TatD family hydrolase n=1 Tax=Marinobacter sp. TaxID=50741 RepID=UPI0034A12F94